MSTSREVAEAYIEVHGDLEPFRRGLDKAGDEARAAGENMADDFGTGWNKRIKSEVLDRWESMLDAMYSNNKLDWNELIGKFDNTDLDRADVQIHDFMNRMREAGKLNAEQYENVSKRVRELIKEKQNEYFVQQDLNKLTRDHIEAIRENVNFDRMRAAASAEALKIETERQKIVDAANVSERDRAEIIEGVSRATRRVRRDTDEAGKSTGLWSTLVDKLKLSWARTDSTIRLAIGAILVAAGPLATLGSGLAGGATAIGSSFAYAVGALGAMVGPAIAFGTAIALAISSFDGILARVPRVQQSLDRIATNWTAQADAFGRQWEGAIDRLLNSFASKMEAFDIGTPLGRAFAEITDGFDRVVNGPSFNAFMTEMTTNFPTAVSGIGRGLAGLTDGFLALFAGAGPVAAQLGEDFARWGQKISEALEKARASGQITDLFQRMRESLLIVLDLVGSMGMTLGTVFSLGAESGNRLLASLTRVTDQFNAWMQTDAGRQAMLTWFNNAERIIRALEPLAVGFGRALAILVTDRSISLFEQFMEAMGELLPLLANILSVISDLGILNILTEAFLAIAKAVQPLLPGLSQIATLLGDLLVGAVRALTPLLVAVGTALQPIIQAAADLWAQVGPALVPAIEQLVAVLTPLIVMVLDLAAAIITQLIPVIGPFFVQYIQSTVQAFTILIGIITQVVSFIISVATELINFFANLGTHIANFNATVNQMLADFWGGIATAFQDFITGFQVGWDTFWGGLGTGLTTLWTDITTQFTNGWMELSNGFNTWVAEFQAGWDAFWNGLGEGLKAVWLAIVTLLTAEYNKIAQGVQDWLITPFRQFWDGFWNALEPETRAYIEGIILAIRMGWENALADVSQFINDFINGWNGFWADVLATHNRKVQETIDGFNKWASDINNTVSTFVSDVINKWNTFWGDVANRARNGWNEIIGGFNNWANSINATVNGFINRVIGDWNRWWSELGARASSGWNDIVGRFNANISNIIGQWNNFSGTVQGIWNGFWAVVTAAANTMMAYLSNIINQRLNEAANFFRNLPGQVGAALGGLANQLYSLGANAVASLGNAIRNGAGAIINAITGIVGGAINAAKRMLGIASPSKVFMAFGKFMDQGLAIGIGRNEDIVTSASAHMADMALEAFDRTKARLAGLETARGLAEGLESSKARVQAALGKLDPTATAAFSASVAGTAARIGVPVREVATGTGEAARQAVVENVNFYTRATDPRVLSGMVVDGLNELVGKSNL